MEIEPKPAHLAPQYGAQFEDAAIAAAYVNRPPYPSQLFDILETLLENLPATVLELGAGSGDITIELAQRVETIDAIEPSAEMLGKALQRPGAKKPNLHWHQMMAEAFVPERKYGLACAAQSLHWMDWQVVLPLIADFLLPGGFLAIIERQVLERPWDKAVYELIPHYSTNKEFMPFDLVQELQIRGLFREVGRQTTAPVPFRQTMAQYIEALHSSNGFSRRRMDPEKALEFDTAVRRAATPYCPEDTVPGQVTGTVIWGCPMPN